MCIYGAIPANAQGYALIQYEARDEAHAAIEACKAGLNLLEQPLKADFAFVEPPKEVPGARARRAPRERSRSPMRH